MVQLLLNAAIFPHYILQPTNSENLKLHRVFVSVKTLVEYIRHALGLNFMVLDEIIWTILSLVKNSKT